jgi:hypothetical protein
MEPSGFESDPLVKEGVASRDPQERLSPANPKATGLKTDNLQVEDAGSSEAALHEHLQALAATRVTRFC